MSTWALIQIVFNIFMALGLFLVIMRMSRAPKDDPRLSRGLQLLQSKISVLEDLSDRTEVQVGQLTSILEQKAREVQAKVQLAEQHVHAIRVAMDRSLEVAKIFQDKIPHQEIIERQNTLKYVHAARLAHQGASVEEIAARVDLPMGEIEFIAKVNRDRLMFNEEQLPWWAKTSSEPGANTLGSALVAGEVAGPAAGIAAGGTPGGTSETETETNIQGSATDEETRVMNRKLHQMTSIQSGSQETSQQPEFVQIFGPGHSEYSQTPFGAGAGMGSGLGAGSGVGVSGTDAGAGGAGSGSTVKFQQELPDLSFIGDASEVTTSRVVSKLQDLGTANGVEAASGRELQQPQASFEETAKRLKAEVELAEHQRLVENLSRLQFEMQNLDIQLAKENSTRNLAQAFEVSVPPTTSLQRLGDEFRKACEEANAQNDVRAAGFAPLEQLTQLIPKSLLAQETPDHKGIFDGDHGASAMRQLVSQDVVGGGNSPVGEATVSAASVVSAVSATVAAPMNAGGGEAKSQINDPVLARAAAQAKVQAALRVGAQSMAKTKAQTQSSDRALAAETGRESLDQLEAARTMAKDAAQSVGVSASGAPAVSQTNRIINGRNKDQEGTVVKRVEFPRIN